MDFLQNHIMTRFGVPISLVFDNASYFSSIILTRFSNERWIKMHYSANYYPQGNGLAHRCVGRQAKAVGPLKPVIISEPFEQWGINIIGEINPNSYLQHKYILIATDHFTRWVKAILL